MTGRFLNIKIPLKTSVKTRGLGSLLSDMGLNYVPLSRIQPSESDLISLKFSVRDYDTDLVDADEDVSY